MARTLQAEGYEVLQAREGGEALRELEETGGGVDLVITDLVMPGVGGVQLARELTQRYPDLRLIWMSGHPREKEFPREMPGKYQTFLMKPVPPDLLLDTARVLEEARRASSR